MKKNIIYNKYYRHLRKNVFSDLEIAEFMKVWINFKKLKLQYRFLQIAKYLEKINISNIEIPIFRIYYKNNKSYTLEII